MTGAPDRAAAAMLRAATACAAMAAGMRDFANAWMASEASASPAAVALVQAAATLPAFLLTLPAGLMSDMLDRRLLLAVQVLPVLVATLLLAQALSGQLHLPGLLALSLLGGLGTVGMAIAPQVVDDGARRSVFAANDPGTHVGLPLGLVAGGLSLGFAGPVATYAVVLVVSALPLAAWRHRPADAPADPLVGALRAGLRYGRASREVHRLLWRAVLFFGGSSAAWALLPWVARRGQAEAAALYGGLLVAIGAGAFVGAMALPWLRERLGIDRLMRLATSCAGAVLLALACLDARWPLLALLPLFGAAWVTVLATLAGLTQALFPAWVRGRGLVIYVTAVAGAMTLGSVGWGVLAEVAGVRWALGASAAAVGLGALWASRSTGRP